MKGQSCGVVGGQLTIVCGPLRGVYLPLGNTDLETTLPILRKNHFSLTKLIYLLLLPLDLAILLRFLIHKIAPTLRAHPFDLVKTKEGEGQAPFPHQ